MLAKSEPVELKIFGPNNHSKFKIGWLPVDDTTSRLVQELVKKNYGLIPARVWLVDEWGRMSRNYRVELANGTTILFRQNIALKNPETLRSLNQLAVFLTKHGINTPAVITNQQGEILTAAENSFWQAFEFIEGDHYRGTAAELVEMATQIAFLHRALEQVDFPVTNASRHHNWNMQQWEDIFRLAAAKRTAVDLKVLSYERFLGAHIPP